MRFTSATIAQAWDSIFIADGKSPDSSSPYDSSPPSPIEFFFPSSFKNDPMCNIFKILSITGKKNKSPQIPWRSHRPISVVTGMLTNELVTNQAFVQSFFHLLQEDSKSESVSGLRYHLAIQNSPFHGNSRWLSILHRIHKPDKFSINFLFQA